MPRSTAARVLPDLVGTAAATGFGMIPLHRLPRSVRTAYVVLPAALTTGAVHLAMRRKAAAGENEEQGADTAGQVPSAFEAALPLVLGGLVAGAGAASICVDKGIETLLRRRGVPAPRVWMGVASGALSLAMVTFGERASERWDREDLEDRVLELLTEADPMKLDPGLSAGAPADEYRVEAEAIAAILHVDGTILGDQLDDVWQEWFDEPLTPLLGQERLEALAAALSALTSPPSAR